MAKTNAQQLFGEASLSRQALEQRRAAGDAGVSSTTPTPASSAGDAHDGSLKLHVLASGSRGNAAIVEDAATGKGILIDCGLCKRDFLARCDDAGFNPAHLAAVLITHDHTDHTKCLGVVLRGLAKLGIEPAVYVNEAVRAASKEVQAVQDACDMRTLVVGDSLSAAGMTVHAFPTSHDAASSCGFRFETSTGDVLGFMTDTGVVTPQAHEALSEARILALESNHDVDMLAGGPYPYPVKKRVASDKGHLSNNQAAQELELLLSNHLQQVVAMHISQNNNQYRLPAEVLQQVVLREQHGACVQVAYQSMLVSVA